MNSRLRSTLCAAVVLVAVSSLAAAEGPSRPDALEDETQARADSYFHLMEAVWLAGQGRQHAAGVALGKALEIRPDSADLRAEAAVLLMSLGRQSDAERQARKALELDPGNLRALRLLAAIVEERSKSGVRGSGGLFEAVSLYERLIQSPEARPEDFSSLVWLRLRLGDRDGAVAAARQLVDRRPGDAAAVRKLVRVLMHVEREPEALTVLLDFLEARPGLGADSPDLEDAANLVEELTRGRDNWDVFEARGPGVLAAQPESGVLYALYGETLLRRGRGGEAIPVLERAMALSGEDPLLKLHLATVYAGIGRLADASDLARDLASEYPDHPGVQSLLGEVLAQQAGYDDALRALERAGSMLKGLPEERERLDAIQARIAWIHLGLGQHEGVREAIAAMANPDSGETLELRARLALDTSDTRGAREIARRLGSAGNTAAALLLDAESWAIEGQPDRALERFEQAVGELGPSIWGRAAEVLRRTGYPARGERVLRKWVASTPEDADAHFRLGAYLEREGKLTAAEGALRDAIRLRGEFPEALNHLGYGLAVQGRSLGEALEMVREALRLDPWNGAYLDSLGWVYYQMGRYQEALDPLERAARELPRDATVLEHLGDCYQSLGHPERALVVWNRALENDPESAEKLRAKIALHAAPARRD